jgi:peroxiredoxin
MTQLVELRDGHQKFADAGMKLYTISYDDPEAIADFVTAHKMPYPILSDLGSKVIRDYGILNTEIKPGDIPVYGVPFPGTYIVDEQGIVTDKFFYDTYKRRDGPENMIDSAVGHIQLDPNEPTAAFMDEGIRVSATLHGAGGVLKQGSMRHLVVRFELGEGLHIYSDPVPEGMIPTTVEVNGPEGLVVQEAIVPPTETFHLKGLDVELQVWSGVVDIVIPVYPNAILLSEMRPLETNETTIDVNIHYQACDDDTCLLPRNRKLTLTVPMAPVDVQALPFHKGHGQNEWDANSKKHMFRLVFRIFRQNPKAFFGGILRQIKLGRAAKAREREQKRASSSRTRNLDHDVL